MFVLMSRSVIQTRNYVALQCTAKECVPLLAKVPQTTSMYARWCRLFRLHLAATVCISRSTTPLLRTTRKSSSRPMLVASRWYDKDT
jgi:hypothetical protein